MNKINKQMFRSTPSLTNIVFKLVKSQYLTLSTDASPEAFKAQASQIDTPTTLSLATKAKVTEQSYFDTHVFVNSLVNSGYTNKQAEQICYLFKDITNAMSQDIKRECVTKPSQELAIQQIMIHIGSLKKDMIILEKSEFSALRSENEKLALQLKALRELINVADYVYLLVQRV